MPVPRKYPRVEFVIGELAEDLESRQKSYETIGGTARRALKIYFYLLAAELRTLDLSEDGWNVIPSAQQYVLNDPPEIALQRLWQGVEEASGPSCRQYPS